MDNPDDVDKADKQDVPGYFNQPAWSALDVARQQDKERDQEVEQPEQYCEEFPYAL